MKIELKIETSSFAELVFRTDGVVDKIIGVYKADPESAHVLEDELVEVVVRGIAKSSSDPEARALAQSLIKLYDADRTRWYA